jgi:hypothetical protein
VVDKHAIFEVASNDNASIKPARPHVGALGSAANVKGWCEPSPSRIQVLHSREIRVSPKSSPLMHRSGLEYRSFSLTCFISGWRALTERGTYPVDQARSLDPLLPCGACSRLSNSSITLSAQGSHAMPSAVRCDRFSYSTVKLWSNITSAVMWRKRSSLTSRGSCVLQSFSVSQRLSLANVETRPVQHCVPMAPMCSLSSCETSLGKIIPISLWRRGLGPQGCRMNAASHEKTREEAWVSKRNLA